MKSLKGEKIAILTYIFCARAIWCTCGPRIQKHTGAVIKSIAIRKCTSRFILRIKITRLPIGIQQ